MSNFLSAFNRSLIDFVTELAEVFPENAKLQVAPNALRSITAINSQLPVNKYVELIMPRSELLANRDERLFDDLHFFDIDFGKLWATDDLPDANRDAIWRYLETLWNLAGMTNLTSCFKPQQMHQIEQIVQQMEGVDEAALEDTVKKLTGSLSTVLGPMLSSLTAGGATGGGGGPNAAAISAALLAGGLGGGGSGSGSGSGGGAAVAAPAATTATAHHKRSGKPKAKTRKH